MRRAKGVLLAQIAVCLPLAAQPNSDPNYRALRAAAPAETYHVENLEIRRDAATLTLRSGLITFTAPVLNHSTMAVFIGDGRFQLKPAIQIEERHLLKVTGASSVEESFDTALLVFSDKTLEEVRAGGRKVALDPKADDALRDFRRKLREKSMTNLEADLLAELYNPAQAGSFRAFLHAKPDSDLRFLIVPSGALPDNLSPEEVALINLDSPERGGICYLSHQLSEWQSQKASSTEDRHAASARHFQIETVINGGQLSGTANIQLAGKDPGARVVSFDLQPSLRVKRVSSGGRELAFIQEPEKDDPFFYVLFPEPLERGRSYQIQVEYAGGKVVHNAGGGSFSVGARESWYPSLNSFRDRATYDLTFKVPKQYTLVSVGKMVREWKENNFACSQWKSDIPLAVAGFNYGQFTKKSATDRATNYTVESYATHDVPDYLQAVKSVINLTPSAMADQALVDAENSIRVFTRWFGEAPYGRIAITQQPEFGFGQSWPSLVYLPVSAFLDSTQRWTLMQDDSRSFAEFIQEVTPHEVSHQWWGHMVGFASYHDQWLSEGFAEFSAGLFLENGGKRADVDRFWDRLRDEIVQKNNFGNSPNDAGPLWLGTRLNSFKTAGAYNRLVYPKGSYFLHMLRMLMQDNDTGDKDFMALMHDYVQTFLHQNPSSEDFKDVIEKHMKPALDAENDHRVDWLFRDWIYGTDLPKYRLEYSVTPAEGGKVVLEGKLTQSNVSPDFLMRVPLYFDVDNGWIRGGRVTIKGNMTVNVKATLPKTPKRVSLNANHDVLAAEVTVKKQ